jgi:RimJ/RimL family protein N-acetyltransferase
MASISPIHVTLKDATPCVIRTATERDATALHDHLTRVAGDGVYIVTEPDEVPSPDEIRRKIFRYNQSPNDLNLVATLEDGSLIGDLLATGGERRRVNHKIRFGLSVDSRYRDRGVGRALIIALLDWAKAHPTIEKIELGVFASNLRGRHLYTSLGFQEEGFRRREIRVSPDVYEDDIAMALFVKPWTPVRSLGSEQAASRPGAGPAKT